MPAIRKPFTIFLKTLSSGEKIYFYQYRKKNGNRSTPVSTGKTSKSEAMEYVTNLFLSGLITSGNGNFKKPSVSFKDFSKDFFEKDSEYMRWKNISGHPLAPETVMSYKKFLRNQLLPFWNEWAINDITPADVKRWILWMMRKWSSKTSNNAQSVFNIIMKSAKENRLIDDIPSEGLTFRKCLRKNRVLLSVSELNAIYHSDKWVCESYRRFFLLAAVTGMRTGEIMGLLRSEVFDNYLNVIHSYSPHFGLGPTKTRVNRYVPIPPEMELKKHCGRKYAFEDKNHRVIKKGRVYENFCRICDDLNIDRESRFITMHTLRNAFISFMRSSRYGAVIDLKIKAVVGHNDGSMTDWYTYWTPESMAEIYELQKELYLKITGKEEVKIGT